MTGPSRRAVLVGLASLGLAPLPPGSGTAATGSAIRYGRDPGLEAPTEASLYVAPDGDDSADGSIGHPLRTIQRGVDLLAMRPEGSLAIRQGIYREMVSLDALQAQSGPGYRLHRHGQEQVRISAAEVLNGWQPCPADAAAALGFSPKGVFVTRIDARRLQHGAPLALNLHEAGAWCSIATDRADPSDPARTGDYLTYHPADFLLDGEDRITAIRDPRLAGLPDAQMQGVRVLVYHAPNLVTASAIARFDASTGTILLADPGKRVQRDGETPVMLYALQNLGTALQSRGWIVREEPDGMLAVYFHPADPRNLESGIEVSLRPACIDLGRARNVELLGLEAVRAAGDQLLDGICIRRTLESDGDRQDLRLLHCLAGENVSAGDRGYAALYLRGARGVTMHNVDIGPTHNSFGLFLSDCQDVDLRFLHIAGVSNSPARFYTLRNGVLAFSLFENSGLDAHSNKFNFYEGSDAVLVYGVRTRKVGGYVTYQEASRIHFGFCEFDCAPAAQNRALVSQNRKPGAGQGGADGSGDPVAGSAFHYWNNSLLADPRTPDPANALVLGPAGTSQFHAFHNNILHGGGFDAVYRGGADPGQEQRACNRYTGLSWWQTARYGWHFGPGEEAMHVGTRPRGTGQDMRPVIAAELAPLFPGFRDWDVDIDGTPVDWAAAPIGCRR